MKKSADTNLREPASYFTFGTFKCESSHDHCCSCAGIGDLSDKGGVYICFLDRGMLSYCLTLSRTSFSTNYLHNFSRNFCTTLCWGEQKHNSCAVYVYLLVLLLTFGLVTNVLPICTRKVCMNKLVTLPTPKNVGDIVFIFHHKVKCVGVASTKFTLKFTAVRLV
jgi:hypothetical protein